MKIFLDSAELNSGDTILNYSSKCLRSFHDPGFLRV